MDVLIEAWPRFLHGFGMTLALFGVSGVGSLVLGTLLAGMRVSPVAPLRGFSATYTEVFRNTPLTLIIFGCAIVLPQLGAKFSDVPQHNYFILACVGFIAYTSAFIGEAIRSGINAIPIGQAEAARSIGLTFGQTLGTIILPQAIRGVIPPIISVLIALVKNTSVAGGFFVVELFSTSRSLINDYGNRTMIILITVAVLYLVVTITLGLLASLAERKLVVRR